MVVELLLGISPPTSVWWATAAAKARTDAVVEDRLDQVDVRQVDAAPAVRVVEDEHVARLEAVAVRPGDVADRGRERAEMERDAEALGDELAAGVQDPGRVVERVADRRRVGGPGDDQGHLVGHRTRARGGRSRASPGRGRRAVAARPARSSDVLHDDAVLVVEPGGPAGRDDRRRVELLDEDRPDDRRPQVVPGDDRADVAAEPWPEPDGARAPPARAAAVVAREMRPGPRQAPGHPDVDELDLVGLGGMAVGLQVGRVEGVAQAADRALPGGPDRCDRHGQVVALPGVADVGAPGDRGVGRAPARPAPRASPASSSR